MADVVDAHADSLGVEAEGALPGRAGMGPLVVGLDPRMRLHQVGLADAAQDGGHHDVSHREVGAGDPLAAFEAALDVTEPAAGELAYLGPELVGGPAADFDATWAILSLAGLFTGYGLLRGAARPTGGLPLQTTAMIVYRPLQRSP